LADGNARVKFDAVVKSEYIFPLLETLGKLGIMMREPDGDDGDRELTNTRLHELR
jgi:hypothetical protein